MKKVTRLSLFAAIIILMGTVFVFPSQAQEISVKRIEGKSRYETAALLSRYTYETSPFVIVATGENYPDALAGGTLAVQLDIPILLTKKDKAEPFVIEEIERLKAEEIFILGGEAAVSKAVENELKKIAKVTRIAGNNRYETSNEISNKRFELRKDQTVQFPGDFYVFVSGTSYPDALCAAPLVGQMSVDGSTNTYMILAQPDHDVSWSTVIGGPNAFGFPLTGYSSDKGLRVYGENRFGTAVEVAKRYLEYTGKKIDTIVLTDGMNYPDALASAPMVGNRNAALLLTRKNALPEETKAYLQENDIKEVIVIGGENAVSGNVVQEIEGMR